ncbi:MAG: hypothetical protein OXF25_07605 [Cyanobacteria bacterium MAG CAR3_bin_5]|nr:hypothetical protein [Cyanobacteria bacterium MAG CAR3_bin_5]
MGVQVSPSALLITVDPGLGSGTAGKTGALPSRSRRAGSREEGFDSLKPALTKPEHVGHPSP